ncbi:MAG: metal-dependent transcriptional regulator [Nanoarchaeales archaeon]|nr:metal-dependent transcriptional regulator [Nanoarchaeales archaeon]
MIRLSRVQEDYLHEIYELILLKKFAKVSDISKKLDVKPSSVNSMVKVLAQKELIIYEKNSPIVLTETGELLAKIVKKQHDTFTQFFEIIGVPKHIAEKDTLKIEHTLNPITLEKLNEFVVDYRSRFD